MKKILILICVTLICISGFRIKVNDNYFEWIGMLEQIYNCLYNKK